MTTSFVFYFLNLDLISPSQFQDLIVNLLSSLQTVDVENGALFLYFSVWLNGHVFIWLNFSSFPAPQNGKLPPLPRGSDTNGSVSTLADNFYYLAERFILS